MYKDPLPKFGASRTSSISGDTVSGCVRVCTYVLVCVLCMCVHVYACVCVCVCVFVHVYVCLCVLG